MTAHDPLISIEVIAAADDHSRRRVQDLPPPDGWIDRSAAWMPAKGWKVSTIAKWHPNPAVAARCAAMAAALERIPLKAA